MKTEIEEKAVSEVKSPTPDAETVEAAKQILTDVLTKAVDAIKETALSGNSDIEEDIRPQKKNFWRVAMDDAIVDYVVRCIYENEEGLLGDGGTFTKSIFSAKGFSSEEDALKYVEERKQSSIIPFTNCEVLMRRMKCQLNEIGHGE